MVLYREEEEEAEEENTSFLFFFFFQNEFEWKRKGGFYLASIISLGILAVIAPP